MQALSRGSIQGDEVDGRIYSTESSASMEKSAFVRYDDDYNTIPSYSDALGLGHVEEVRKVGQTGTFFTSYNVICAVVGTGLLQLPYGLSQSGWSGVMVLFAIGAICAYTAIILVQCMSPPSGNKLYTYSEIGYEALGTPGRAAVEIFLHATLLGVSTIYLILAGK
jgi:hypothetical protein